MMCADTFIFLLHLLWTSNFLVLIDLPRTTPLTYLLIDFLFAILIKDISIFHNFIFSYFLLHVLLNESFLLLHCSKFVFCHFVFCPFSFWIWNKFGHSIAKWRSVLRNICHPIKNEIISEDDETAHRNASYIAQSFYLST